MSQVLTVRIPTAEYHRLKADAAESGDEFSDYVRALLGCANPTNAKSGRGGTGMQPLEFGLDRDTASE